jgi:tetratricopeptide (TPR) repeat protein
MERPHNRVDKDGFPIPATFDNDRVPTGGGSSGSGLSKRWMTIIVLAPVVISLIIAAVFYSGAATQVLLERASQKFDEGDYAGALGELDQITALTSELPKEFFHLRARVRAELQDLPGAESDANEFVNRAKYDKNAYQLRSQILQRLSFATGVDRHKEAVADLEQARELSSDKDPMPFNNLAYGRALSGRDLEQGLKEANQAVDLWTSQAADPLYERGQQRDLRLKGSQAAILDTRGYLHFLAGNLKEGLADMDQSIKSEEEVEAAMMRIPELQKPENEKVRARFQEEFDHTMAVLRHHRGLIHEKLGNQEAAKADFEKAKALGYDPKRGVF